MNLHGGSARRGEQMARPAHQMRTDPAAGELLSQIETSDLARDPESAAS